MYGCVVCGVDVDHLQVVLLRRTATLYLVEGVSDMLVQVEELRTNLVVQKAQMTLVKRGGAVTVTANYLSTSNKN